MVARSIPDTARRIDIHLAEFRIMGPALGALLGFQLTAALGPAYPDLPAHLRAVNFFAVACTTVALVFSLLPTAYHRLAHATDDDRFVLFVRRNTSGAMLALAASLVLSFYAQAERSFGGASAAVVAAAATAALVVVAWIVVPHRLARRYGARVDGHRLL